MKATSPSRRVLVAALAFVLALLLVAIGALLSAPLWIDAVAVKKEIASLVLRATGDVVELDRIQLRLFPSISIEVTQPRYAVPGIAQINARTAEVDLAYWPLLQGRVQPGNIRLTGLQAVIHVPANTAQDKPVSAAERERQLHEILAALAQAAPQLRASVDHAIVTLHLPGRAPLVFNDIDAEVRASGAKIEARLSGASEFWERVSLAAWMGGDPLQGAGRLEFVGLDTGRLQDWLGPDPTLPRADAALIGRIDWQMRGLSDLKAEVIASTPWLALHRNGAVQEIRGITAAAGLELKGPAMKLALHRLYAQAPKVLLSAGLSRDERGRHELQLNASGADLVALQSAARTLAADIPLIAKPPVLLRAGTLTALQLDSSAESLSELFDLPLLRGEAALEGVALDVAQPRISLSGVGGRIALDHGDLEVRNATAVLGKSVLRDGKLAMRLPDGPGELRAEARIDLDFGEALVLARKLIKRKDIAAELDAVQRLDGKALAHVAVWGRPQALRASVEMSQLALFVQHRSVPLPLQLAGGRFTFADGSLAIRDVAGQFGSSGFEDLSASLSLSPPYQFELSQRKSSLSLEELYTAARQIRALAPALKEIGNLTGTAVLSEVAAEGSLRAPEATRFRAVVSPRNVKLLPRRFDTEMRFDGGSIEISDRLIEARDISINAIDSSLRASVRTEDYRTGIHAIDATLGGDLGAATLERIYQIAGLAPAMQVRAPLHFSDLALSWKDNGDAALRGKVGSAGAVELEVAARKAGNRFILERLAVKGQASDAVFSGDYAGKDLSAAFKGNLTGAAIAGLLVQPPVSMQGIEGDMRARIRLEKPWIKHLEGRLHGTAITLPAGPALALKVEHIDLKANGEKARIESAVLSINGNLVEFSGDVGRQNGKIVLDADVRADRLVLTKAMMGSDAPQDGDQEPFRLSDLPVAGRIGIDIRSLESERLNLAPLVAEIAVAQESLDLHITEAALCGITVSGTLKGQIDNVRLAGKLAARNADMRKSIACLSNNHIVSSGTMDIDAKFSAEGPLAQLGERLDGRFSATSRDGNIEQFDTLNRIFSFLNVTELVRGGKLGASGTGLPYRTAKGKGTLAGTAIHIEEAELDAPAVHIAAAGHLDYGNDKLRMDVLVAPLQTANVVVDHIPLMNRIFGGAVLALPVQVLGTLKNPIIVPLGPGAVASRMTSIIANTMRLPVDAIKVFSPHPPKASGATPGEGN